MIYQITPRALHKTLIIQPTHTEKNIFVRVSSIFITFIPLAYMPFLGIDTNAQGKRAFNACAQWVDESRGPGETPHPTPAPHTGQIVDNLTLGITQSGGAWYTALAIILYIMFPFDLTPSGAAAQGGPISLAFFRERLPIWLTVTLTFYTVIHVGIYGIRPWKGGDRGGGVIRRPFVPNRQWRLSRVLHNAKYAVLGVLVYTGYENCLVYLFASGKLPFLSDQDALSSPLGALCLFLSLFIAQPYREVHFYFVHRLIHLRPLYRYIHSVHHRNTDPEPFAGICMHPVEHLYYITPILPSFFLPFLSPIAVVNAGVWALISPGFAHSGYEDHFHASAAHYYHHRYFECNYGAGSWHFLDVWCGTWVCGWKPHEPRQPLSARRDAKADIFAPPTPDAVLYMVLSTFSCFGLWAYAAGPAFVHVIHTSSHARFMMSFAIGCGPLLIAVALFYLFRRRNTNTTMTTTTSATSTTLLSTSTSQTNNNSTPRKKRMKNLSSSAGRGDLLGTALHTAIGVSLSALPLTYIVFTVLSGHAFFTPVA